MDLTRSSGNYRPKWIISGVLSLTLVMVSPPASAETGKQLLDKLIQKAKQEGQLVATVQSSWRRGLPRKLTDAYKKRFGLDIDVTVTPVRPAKHYPIAIAETKIGSPPTYDVIQAADSENMTLIGVGGTEKIENWKALLSEINPLVGSGKVKPERISRGPFSGHAFQFMRNVKVIIYNPKLISKRDLPKTHKDLANPKFKDMFTQPPWTAHWEIAPAVLDNFDKQEWLQIVRQAGKNTNTVLPSSTGSQRVALGEFAFGLGHDAYIARILGRDPKANIALAFFSDYNESNGTYYIVRKRTRHLAAATLYALWMTSPDAQAIWQPRVAQAQPWGESERDRKQARFIKESNAIVVGFLDNPRTIKLLKWYSTDEGRKYIGDISRAIRGE